jgi:hypothetical protein
MICFTGVSFLKFNPRHLTTGDKDIIERFIEASDYSDVDDNVRFFSTREQNPELHGGIQLFAQLKEPPGSMRYAYDNAPLLDSSSSGRYDKIIQ